jgi:hypothetical protein
MYKIIGADQKQYGPVSSDDIRNWVREGRATGQTLVQAEGQTEWRPLSSFPEFANLTAPLPSGAPQMSAPGMVPTEKIPNYLVQAILCTLCCCLPGGIAAIVYAAQVNTKQSAGDIQGAMTASANAKKWCWISFGVGIVLNLIIFGAQIVAGFASGFGQK